MKKVGDLERELWREWGHTISRLEVGQVKRLFRQWEILWAVAWGLVNPWPSLWSYPLVGQKARQGRSMEEGDVRLELLSELQLLVEKVRAYPELLGSLLRTHHILDLLATHELDWTPAFESYGTGAFTLTRPTRSGWDWILRQCGFRQVHPQILGREWKEPQWPAGSDLRLRLVPGYHRIALEAGAQVVNMGLGLAGFIQLLVFFMNRQDLGEGEFLVAALGDAFSEHHGSAIQVPLIAYHGGVAELEIRPVNSINWSDPQVRILTYSRGTDPSAQ